MFIMNRTVFVGTEGGPNSIIVAQEGPVHVIKQNRASSLFLLFIVLTAGPQWSVILFSMSSSLLLVGIFTFMMLPLFLIWAYSLRAFYKNPQIRIDTANKQVVLEKRRFKKKRVVIKPEAVERIQIIYTFYQHNRGETNSNFILELVFKNGKSRMLCISDNLYLIRKAGLRVHEALGAPFDPVPVDDATHSSLWDWRSRRKKIEEPQETA